MRISSVMAAQSVCHWITRLGDDWSTSVCLSGTEVARALDPFHAITLRDRPVSLLFTCTGTGDLLTPFLAHSSVQ